MPEIAGLEWWRWVWGPALSGGLIWLATVWKNKNEARGSLEARLDKRQEGLLSQLEDDLKDLRTQIREERTRCELAQAEADRMERVARWWFRTAHTLSHSVLSARMGARHALLLAGKTVPETWDMPEELPPFENPWAVSAAPDRPTSGD